MTKAELENIARHHHIVALLIRHSIDQHEKNDFTPTTSASHVHSMHPRESSQHGVYMGWKAKGTKVVLAVPFGIHTL